MVDAGIRAASRSQRVFDDLVEVGLGRGTLTPALARGLAGSLRSTPSATFPRPRPAAGRE